MAFPTGWTKKHKLSIDYTKVSGTDNLVNFPVLLTQDNFLTEVFDHTQGQEIFYNYLYADDALEGYWRLESDGTDSSPNGYTLVAGNLPEGYVAGKFGNGADFEASNSDYLKIDNASCPNLEISGSQTWQMWIKGESFADGGYNVCMTKRSATVPRGFTIYSNGIYFDCGGLSDDTCGNEYGNFVTGVWYHCVYVFDAAAGKSKLFINGVKHEESVTGTMSTSTGDFTLGGTPVHNQYFDGVMDDCAIWSRALTDAEVVGLYKGGMDLRFSSDDAGATELAFEIVDWNNVDNTAEVWVKIPSVSYTANTVFYVWYDNPTALPYAKNDTYGSDNAWESNFKGVWHMPDYATTNIADSTANGNTGTKKGLGEPAELAASKIGKGQNFDGSNDYISVASHSSLDITGHITLSAWVQVDNIVNYAKVIVKPSGAGWSSPYFYYSLGACSTAIVGQFAVNTNSNEINSGSSYSLDTWYYISGTYDGTNERLYINGSEVNSKGVTGAISTSTQPLCIGMRSVTSAGEGTDGYIDEVRVTAEARTAGWLMTEYNNQSNPATFIIESAGIAKVSSVTRTNIGKILGKYQSNIDKVATASF